MHLHPEIPLHWEKAPVIRQEKGTTLWLVRCKVPTNGGFAALQKYLPAEDIARINRLEQIGDRNASALGIAGLQDWVQRLTGCSPEQYRVLRTVKGKPFLEGPENLIFPFNWSHSGGYVVWAFIWPACPQQQVGIDIEIIKPVTEQADIAAAYFSKREYAFWSTAALRDQAFFQIWTRKEALLKCAGIGLSEDLPAWETLDDKLEQPSFPTFNLRTIPFGDDYAVAVAWTGELHHIRLVDWVHANFTYLSV